jgi:hypothetical protein
MDQDHWPDIAIAVVVSLVFVGLPAVVIALALLG